MNIAKKKAKESKLEFVLMGKDWKSRARAEEKMKHLESIGYKKIKENSLKVTYKK
jgi:5,10-methylene-tetrahydrofolate dehydrogenase/methenyl tetrahydrofolate cyclohydrolase